jgi:hypothetical protein
VYAIMGQVGFFDNEGLPYLPKLGEAYKIWAENILTNTQ